MADEPTVPMPTLLPCPCCGGRANFEAIPIREGDPQAGGQYIECEGCGLCTGLRFACMDDPKPELAEVWNRRMAA